MPYGVMIERGKNAKSDEPVMAQFVESQRRWTMGSVDSPTSSNGLRYVPMLVRMYRKRLAGYRAMGYSVTEEIVNP